MIVGHLGLAFASKRLKPNVSLGWFVAAATMLDLVWPVLLLTGIERVSIVPGATAFNPYVFDAYPWSHSLVMAVVWGILLAGIARAFDVPRDTGPLLVALVVSHWVLDYVTHGPDLPIWPGASSPRLGLGLWNSVPGTLLIEGAIWVAGIALYLAGRSPKSPGPRVALWALIAISTAMWASSPWMAPPPSAAFLGWYAMMGWLVAPWAGWADRGYVLRAKA